MDKHVSDFVKSWGKVADAWGTDAFNESLLACLSDHYADMDFSEKADHFWEEVVFDEVTGAYDLGDDLVATVSAYFTEVTPTSCPDVALTKSKTANLKITIPREYPEDAEVEIEEVGGEPDGDYY